MNERLARFLAGHTHLVAHELARAVKIVYHDFAALVKRLLNRGTIALGGWASANAILGVFYPCFFARCGRGQSNCAPKGLECGSMISKIGWRTPSSSVTVPWARSSMNRSARSAASTN